MCIEFVIQVLKQKNARVSCPVGMVFRQELKHVKIGHVKIDQAHFHVHFREHWKISREHSRGSLRGDPVVTEILNFRFVGISVDFFVYTPVLKNLSGYF